MKALSTRCILPLLFLFCLTGSLLANISFTSGTPPNAAVNTAYSFTFTAQDFACEGPSFQFSPTGTLPSWLTLSTAGVLSSSTGPAISGPGR